MPISESGTATLGMTVAHALRRKRKTTRMTRAMEMQSVHSTSTTEARMVVVRSSATSSLIDAGIAACSCGISERTRSTVPMMFAPGWRKRTSEMAGLPLTCPALLMFSTESVTSATSDRITGLPSREAMMRLRYWFALKS